MSPPKKRSKPKDYSNNLHRPSKKAHKSTGSRTNGAMPASSRRQLHLQVEDDVPDFPRGGGSSLSWEERNDVRAVVDKEFTADQRVLKKMKEKRNQNNSTEDDLGSLYGDGVMGKSPRFANKIILKNISSGMKLWGVIAEVNEKDILVSLPGGLRGLVRANEAFDRIWDDELGMDADDNFLPGIYHVGQLVSCVVLQINNDKKEIAKQKIWLSLRLSLLHNNLTLDVIQKGMVLNGYVKSIEDHGFILHFGLHSFEGFLPQLSERRTIPAKMGQVLQGIVESVDKTRKVVYLTCDPDVVSKCVTKELKGVSIDLLVPGMMVNARVQSTLENGIMLSFLTYFNGTVDLFNLDKTFPSSNWKDDYAKNMKFNARILFIDPSTRAVGLTLNPHLVSNRAPPSLLKVGDIFDKAKVVRVDKGSGLLLEIPTSPVPTPGYVSVADVADKEVHKLEKAFKEGSLVRVRVLGFRLLEGLATGILKTSAFEGSVFTHSDVKPGMLVKAKVIAVDSFGAIVQFASGVKALCPLRHMSEFEITKPRKKFQVGVELVFRVLGCKSKRITVTHKKTLVKSKLEILSSYADATEGLVTHGWITKIENHGCFVRFYSGVQGFAHRSELGLDPGTDIRLMYHIEQVVKCRILKCFPASHRIELSFNMRSKRKAGDQILKPGSLVSGIVDQITPDTVVVAVNNSSHMKGMITLEHLADNHGLAAKMMSALRPGYHFDQLLVLDIGGNNIVLTAKYSLINSSQQLPADVNQVHPHSVLHGYVCNIIETGCFVRFIGHLTGFAPKSKATDDRTSNLSEVFYIGQSVRCNIVDVSNETSRITLSLKQSLCCSTDASFIQEYFLVEEKIAKLQMLEFEGPGLEWADEFRIGSVVEGKVQETKSSGVAVRFEKHNDVFGFIPHNQLAGITVEDESLIQAVVLDVSKSDCLVDLSIKPDLINRSEEGSSSLASARKTRKREVRKELVVNQTVNAIVEIVKDNYLVLSIPSYGFTIGYASLTDYNTQKLPPKRFSHGESVCATVLALPAPATTGRLLLLLKSTSVGVETSSSKRAKTRSNYDVGVLVQAEVTEIKPLELRLKFGSGFLGRVHITEATDDNSIENPFSVFKVGQTLAARIVSKGSKPENNRGSYQWELSIKPSLIRGSTEIDERNLTEDFNYSYGKHVSGFVYKIDHDWAWLAIDRDVKARLYILDSSCEPSELEEFQKRFYVGKCVSGYIIGVNKEKKLLRIALHPSSIGSIELAKDDLELPLICHISEGSAVGGRVSKILPGVGGLLIQIDQHLYGKAHFTELTDSWISNPLSGYQEGQFLKCKVLEISHAAKGTVHVDLSLRLASCDLPDQRFSKLNSDKEESCQRVGEITDLHPDMVVQGYVKNISSKGCFIMLSRKLDAKILLSNLSDSFVENPEAEFPIGKLVVGRVLSVEPLSKRVEVTLKTKSTKNGPNKDTNCLDRITVGDIFSGRIKRVESYGLFISIDGTNVVGLCHISELSDDHVDNIDSEFKTGDIVTTKVLKVDKDRNRVSLGVKNSYFKDEEILQSPLAQMPDYTIQNNDSTAVADQAVLQQSSSAGIEGFESESGCELLLVDAESRADVPPLEVLLDDIECLDVEGDVDQGAPNAANVDFIEENKFNKAKKKAREEKEREVRAAEERLLEKDIPRNADEFEKLIRSSPNSSFLWIKYMAFMISLADVEKARSIAERALRTINIREESEKLNIWVAYFNLENQYGSPPEEAVAKIFQRALQYCDPKKVHLALLDMYERTEQRKLANELLDRMTKKFKHSCKIWLRRIQPLLKQNSDGVQSLVNRALLTLPRHKHIKFISKSAILEFKCGVPDRGRSLFEGMLREYPRRTDLWSIYLDQEIRLGDADVIRALFERAISLSLPPKKMKFLFKKYLEYEKSMHDEEQIESVKKKAMEYVESTLV